MVRKPSVCRRLNFEDMQNREAATGPGEDPPEMGNGSLNNEEEIRSQLEAAKQRWNFDFENEVPLEGRWAWEKVAALDPTVQGQADAENEASEFDADRPEQ